jgi:gas vesicle protein
VGYIKDEPVKSVLIAAVAGATLCALASLLMRPRMRD